MKNMLEEALRIAIDAHEGQKDKGGVPYIAHICAVVAGVKGDKARIVAALHDAVEDSSLTFESLRDRGFSPEIVDAVDAITKRPGEDYSDYIERVSGNPLAREVKLADLAHNLAPSRRKNLTKKDSKRIGKYMWAAWYLRRSAVSRPRITLAREE